MHHTEGQFEGMRKAHPLDAALFGTMGAVTAALCADVSKDFMEKQFEFMDVSEFREIRSPSVMNHVYWKETLFRVYWAAALNLMRHQRWQAGCVRAFSAPANLLGFASSLRGLVEASLDASYSLNNVPLTLANNRVIIKSALEGRLQGAFTACEELEDQLIHFLYGRKIRKADKATTPTSHVALEPSDYRNAAGLPERDRETFGKLYDELCGLCHPTALSLSFLWSQSMQGKTAIVHIARGDDEARIKKACQKYKETIQFAMCLSVNASALCLKALNWFSLAEVTCPSIQRWNFEDIPAWRKVQATLSGRTPH